MLKVRKEMKYRLSNLRGKRKRPVTEFDLNNEVVQAFVRVLDKRKLSTEGFFRAVNKKGK